MADERAALLHGQERGLKVDTCVSMLASELI